MAETIKNLKGMTAELADKLKTHGITDTDEYLKAAGTTQQRSALAKAVGVEPSVLLELQNRADLARIKGIGGVYADLLENAGVDTVKELSHRRPDSLHAKLAEINSSMKLTSHPPTEAQCEAWVAEAKQLDTSAQ